VKHDYIHDARTKGQVITLCGASLTWDEVALATGPDDAPGGAACEECRAIEAAWRFGSFDAAPCGTCQLDGEWLPQKPGACRNCNGRRWVMLRGEALLAVHIPEHIPGLSRW
jgi:DNA-directed RNA polymerase subunit RPC12/RpoP